MARMDGEATLNMLDPARMTDALAQARKALKLGHERPETLAKRCFHGVSVSSRALIMAGIPHSIAVGNFKLNGKFYYSTTPESLIADMLAGFDETHPANAHTWIEFASGEILDPTVLVTIAVATGRRLKWNEAIYISGQRNRDSLVHVSMIDGMAYHRRVVNPNTSTTYEDRLTSFALDRWKEDLDELNRYHGIA